MMHFWILLSQKSSELFIHLPLIDNFCKILHFLLSGWLWKSFSSLYSITILSRYFQKEFKDHPFYKITQKGVQLCESQSRSARKIFSHFNSFSRIHRQSSTTMSWSQSTKICKYLTQRGRSGLRTTLQMIYIILQLNLHTHFLKMLRVKFFNVQIFIMQKYRILEMFFRRING